MREEDEDGTGDPVVAGRVVDVGGGPVTAPQEGTVAGDGLDREAVRRRADAATPGPWEAGHISHVPAVFAPRGERTYRPAAASYLFPADAEFIAHARTDVPALLAALEAAEAEVRRLRTMAEATAEHDARKAIAGRFVAGGWEKNSVCERYYPKCCSYHEGFDDALAEYGHMLRTNDLEAP